MVGIKEQIDCYDLIKSGFANDVDDATQIYWIMKNAGGMDDVDLRQFLDRLKTVKAAVMEQDGAYAEPHTIDVPTDAREKLLDRLEKDLYKDYMALDTDRIASGSVAIVQIMAAYEPMNSKADLYEQCIRAFLDEILNLAEIDDSVTFERSYINNTTEQVELILQSALYLPREYVVEKLLTLMGDKEKVESVMEQIEVDDLTIGE